MKRVTVNISKLNKEAVLPEYTREGDSGFDLRSVENTRILPGRMAVVSTGLALDLPSGYEVQIRPRSGLSMKGITVNNSPGTIDSNYRGELKIILSNHGVEIFNINVGDRIAQGVLQEVPKAVWNLVDTLTESNRGEDGFGSSGVK